MSEINQYARTITAAELNYNQTLFDSDADTNDDQLSYETSKVPVTDWKAAWGVSGTNGYVPLYTSTGNGTLTESLIFQYATNSNIGIGTVTPDASALLQVASTTKGFLPPVMDETQLGNIASPAQGLMAYVTDDKTLRYYNASIWVKLTNGIYGGNGTTPSSLAITMTDDITFGSNLLFLDESNTKVRLNTASAVSTEFLTVNGASYVTGNTSVDGQVSVGRGVTGLVSGGGSTEFEVITTTANSSLRMGHSLKVGFTNTMGIEILRGSSASYSVAHFIGAINTDDLGVATSGRIYWYDISGNTKHRTEIGYGQGTWNFGNHADTDSLVAIAGNQSMSSMATYDDEGIRMTSGGSGQITHSGTMGTTTYVTTNHFGGDTFVGDNAQTVTIMSAMKVEANTASTNFTFTDNYAIWCNGAMLLDDVLNLTPIAAPGAPTTGFNLYVDNADGDLKAISSTSVITVLALN